MGRPKLTATVRNAVAHRRMRCRLHDLEREASETGFGELIGNSEPMRRVYREITRLAQSEITVLVFGESGTGKELVARALHDHSGRSRAPFVALNCAAVPENLQESEFFGHEKGAFTGAEERRIGRFEQALTPPERPVPELAQELQALLRAYGWPGNVRELKNAIHRALVAADGQVLTVDGLPPRMRRQTPRRHLHALPPVESQTIYRKLKAYGLR